MFLLVHATVGALAGNTVGQPILGPAAPAIGFAGGFVSHFVIDMIPHGDEAIGRIFADHRHAKWLAALAIFDGMSALCVIAILAITGQYTNALAAVAGAIGGMLPDIMVGVSELRHKKLWPKFLKFHDTNHARLNYEVRPWVGGIGQVVTLAIILTLTINPYTI